jgi:predicted Zn finger-like uncharacterized protein
MKTQCPNCKARFNANETSVGKQAKCPKCAKPFTIEPFIETPASPARLDSASSRGGTKRGDSVAVETPAKKPVPVEPLPKSPAPIIPPVKSPEPVKPPVKSAELAKEEKPETKAVSKGLSKTVFVYCWIAIRIIAGIFSVLGLVLAIRKGSQSTLIATFAAADVFLVCSIIIELSMFYKMWAAIQDDQASISPAKAVGFLFIPVFNIYWVLLMVTGFAEDYNAFIQRQSVKTRDLPMSLFLIYAFAFILSATVVTTPMICVFAFVGLISRAFIGYPLQSWLLFSFVSAAGVGHFIAYLLVAIKTCNAINALPERKGTALLSLTSHIPPSAT